MVTAAHGTETSWFSASYGLRGLQTFVTPVPQKSCCHEITNLPVARKKTKQIKEAEENEGEKLHSVMERPSMQGLRFTSGLVILGAFLEDKIHKYFSPSKAD